MKENSNNYEIDVYDIIKKLYDNKLLLILTLIFSVIIAISITKLLPNQYKSKTTFFINNNNKNFNPLSSYSSLLGKNNSEIEGKLKSILESKLITEEVIEYLKINKKIDINSQKNFSLKSFSYKVNQNNLYILTFYNSNQELPKLVLNAYLNAIIKFNEKFNLSSEKNLITVLDKAETPETAFKPNLIKNIVFAVILNFLLVSLYIILILKKE